MLTYKTILSQRARRDLMKISKYMKNYNSEKIIEKIYKDIDKLYCMPRINKTLISSKDRQGEYRRKISGKYSIIYKINDNQIIILRIFNQKQNYLNSKMFILREKSQNYILIK